MSFVGNRRALLPELTVDGGVVVRRVVVRIQDAHTVLHQEAPEEALVLRRSPTVRGTGPQLAQNDERQQDLLGRFEQRDRLREALAEIDVSIGVE